MRQISQTLQPGWSPSIPNDAPADKGLLKFARHSPPADKNRPSASGGRQLPLYGRSPIDQRVVAIGSGYFCGVRDEIYHQFGTDSDELLQAGLQKWDAIPTTPTEPPRQPVIRSVEEVTPTSCKIKIEVTPTAKDYKYFMGTTADTAAMTLKDTSSKTTFIYEGLTEGTKYFFAVKARNAAGESAFSAVVNRRTF